MWPKVPVIVTEPEVVMGPPVNDIPVVPPLTPTDDTLAPAVMPSSFAA